jgi:hypothetical protein
MIYVSICYKMCHKNTLLRNLPKLIRKTVADFVKFSDTSTKQLVISNTI